MFRKAVITFIAGLFILTGCSEEERKIRIGSKNFGESRILAHMMAAVIREQGLPVAGVVEYENTPAILEALKRGDIDAYPEYNGTGLVMLGQSPLTDGDEALAQVKKVFEPLGISWRERVGFANNYGLAMTPDRADELGVTSMSDLAPRSSEVTIGVEDDFTQRPLDGLTPMNQRYGFEFGSVSEVPLSDRGQLYDQLLDGSVDVIEVYTTDGQIADYDLQLLEDDLDFFPVYELAPIVRTSALSEFQGLGAALDTLGGILTNQEMQALNRRVDLEGRAPEAVARDTLARLGIISSGAVEAADPLTISTSPLMSEGGLSGTALRAARRAYVGREVVIHPANRPLQSVTDGTARLALVGAESFFDLSGPTPSRLDQYEGLAVIGTNAVHLVASTADDSAGTIQDATALLTGPEGSGSYLIATILKDALGLSADITPSDAAAPGDILAGLSGAQVAVIAAPPGENRLEAAFEEGGLKLLPVTGWEDGGNLVKYPFLRRTRVPGGTYALQFTAVETLSSQVVLAGPAPGSADAAIGEQGPGATAAPSLKPVPDSTVVALAEGVSGGELIDPVLPVAAAFAPKLPEPPAAMNPSPDVSLLNLGLTAMFVWLGWLFVRRETP